ncbi:DUF3488 and transglutaminase-like domain-containing protein [Streptomyces sp. J2-1]|uniref:transglutaminase TgpA family protein n=1 Tax=Streptomyces corallincola TaxID=2851888 RepID=UPI001C38FFCB|nr:DUF3488 and transglutaminase-like domain-containing protein [Streptomyces corallincola]MBV2355617.1 DUF3488 and transglutaminase-like domain-containing protein [Streptomyces corallincola]
MSGRARLALCAAAATLMAGCALLPLVDRPTWLVQAVLLVACQTGVGAAARRVPLARLLTVAAQAVVSVLLLTLVFAHKEAVAGILPGPDALGHFADLFRQGGTDVKQYAIPAPLTNGIRLMLVGGVLLIGLLVDALAVTYRSAAPAGLPLLALYSVAAGLADGAADWLWFLVAAAGYLMLLLAEGRDRLAQWGRVFGGPARTGGPGGAAAPVRTGRRIGAVALGLALVVPLVLPAMSGGLLDSVGRGGVAANRDGDGISAVNPLVSLRDSLNAQTDRQVLSLRTSDDDLSDLYLRIVSLDDFDGTTWQPSAQSRVDVPDRFPDPVGLAPDVRRVTVRTKIAAAQWYAQDWLPMPYPPSGVRVDGNWRYQPGIMTLIGNRGQTTRGMSYEVSSLDVRPTARQLADAPPAPAALTRAFTKVPSRLPAVVARTAREVTGGATNHYEQAVKLQDWFAVSGGFQYDTQVRVGRGPDAIANFLKAKQGFCVHFAFSMAAMARTLGIPARVAVGFAPGTPQSDGTVSVSLKDAHAWPELYFQGVGWTRFEPTPTRGTVPAYTVPDATGSSRPDPELPSRGASSAPSASASAGRECVGAHDPDACASTAAAVPSAGGGGGTGPWPWVALAALAALVLLALPLTPMLWRARARGARLGGHGRTEEGIARHVLAAWRELTDSAWDLGLPPDDALTPRATAERLVAWGRLDAAAGACVHRVADAVEQVLYAPRPRPAPGVAEDVRRAVAALSASVSGRTRLRARFLPRSAVRLVWSLSVRRRGFRERLAALRPVPRRASGQRG